MRIKTLVLILIAMFCGLLATIGISQVIDRQGKGQAAEMVKIFVASADVDIGDALTAENVELDNWPKDRVPEGAITKLEELENRFARQRMYAGEPVMTVKLMDSNSDTTMTIPEGFRACSIKVSGEVTVGNLVKPGDRVDVIVFLRKNDDVPITSSRTILRDVRIFAVNAKTEREVDEEGQVTMAQTVSLLVTPKQVELVTLAAQLGNLRLSLRRPNDTQESDDEGTTVDSFMDDTHRYGAAPTEAQGAAPAPWTPPATREPLTMSGPIIPDAPTDSQNPLLRILNQMTSAAPVEAPKEVVEESIMPVVPVLPVEPVEPPPPPAFSMIVHSPQGLMRYDWQDEQQLPEAVSVGADVPQAPQILSTPAPATKAPPRTKKKSKPDTNTSGEETTNSEPTKTNNK